MWSLINPDDIGSYMLCAISFGIAAVILRYRKKGDAIFWDGSTYFLLLTYLYVCVPAYVHLNTGLTLVGASPATILFVAQYSLYFTAVFTFYYLLKSICLIKRRPCVAPRVSRNLTVVRINDNILYLIYSILITYALSVFFIKFPGFGQLWSDRALASDFRTELNETYKIALLFAVTVTMVAYLAIKNRKIVYLLMFVPFVMMDLFTTDRVFPYQTLLVSIGIMLLANKKIPVVKLALMGLFTVSIEVIRVVWQDNFGFDKFLFIPGELLFTAESGLLMIESQMSISFVELIIYSFGKALSPQLMMGLFVDVPHFSKIINAESPLPFGLGGSLLSEVFSLKSTLALVVFPFVAIVYLEVINTISRKTGFFGALIFLFFLMTTHAFFRSGLIFMMMEPVYYALYAGVWYWVIRYTFANGAVITIQL